MKIYIILTGIIIISCSDKIEQKDELKTDTASIINDSSVNKKVYSDSSKEIETKAPAFDTTGFHEFWMSFELDSFPIKIKGCSISTMDIERLDYSLMGNYQDKYAAPFKRIKKDSILILIKLGLADCAIPTLITINAKTGALIDEEQLSIGKCGSDCGYTCEDFVSINSDLEIYSADSITVMDCNDEMEPIPESKERYVLFRHGYIKPDGSIELSKLKKETI